MSGGGDYTATTHLSPHPRTAVEDGAGGGLEGGGDDVGGGGGDVGVKLTMLSKCVVHGLICSMFFFLRPLY